MKRYSLAKYMYNLEDKDVSSYLLEKYRKYYSQQFVGHKSSILFFNTNLVFAKKIGNNLMIVSVLAPAKKVRDFWCTFPLQKLSRKIFDLFYKHKYILL